MPEPAYAAHIANTFRYFRPIRYPLFLAVPPDVLRQHTFHARLFMCGWKWKQTERQTRVCSNRTWCGVRCGALVSKYVSARRSDAVRLAYVIVESRAQELDDGYYYCFQTFQLPVNRRSNSFVVFFVHHRSFALVSHKSYLRCILLKITFHVGGDQPQINKFNFFSTISESELNLVQKR